MKRKLYKCRYINKKIDDKMSTGDPIIKEPIIKPLSVVVGKYFSGDPEFALKEAIEFAKENGGSIYSLSQLLSEFPWDRGITALYEEDIGKTEVGNPVMVGIQGGGIFASPERIAEVKKNGKSVLTESVGGRLHPNEIKDVLNGNNGIPNYPYDEFYKNDGDYHLPFSVTIDFERVQKIRSGSRFLHNLIDDPLFIIRSGGPSAAIRTVNNIDHHYFSQYFRLFKEFRNYASSHPFKYINPEIPQGRLVHLIPGYANGIDGGGRPEISTLEHTPCFYVGLGIENRELGTIIRDFLNRSK